VILNVLKTCQFPQFTVDDASNVNLKTHFAGNSNKKAQLTQGLRVTAVRVYRHIGVLKFESCTISSAFPKTPPWNQIACRSANRLRSYGHFCISKMTASRHLGFYRIGNSAIRSAFPENPSLEPNMRWIGCTFARYLPLNYIVTLKLEFGVTEGHRKRGAPNMILDSRAP